MLIPRTLIVLCFTLAALAPLAAESGPELVERLLDVGIGERMEIARSLELPAAEEDRAADHLVEQLLSDEPSERLIDLLAVARALGERGTFRRSLLRHKDRILATCREQQDDAMEHAVQRRWYERLQAAMALLRLLPLETAELEAVFLELEPRTAESSASSQLMAMGLTGLLQDIERQWSEDFRAEMGQRLMDNDNEAAVLLLYSTWQMLVIRKPFDVDLYLAIRAKHGGTPGFAMIQGTILRQIEPSDMDARLAAVLREEVARDELNPGNRIRYAILLHPHDGPAAETAMRAGFADPELTDFWRQHLAKRVTEMGLGELVSTAAEGQPEAAASAPEPKATVAEPATPEAAAPKPGSPAYHVAQLLANGARVPRDLELADAVPDDQVDAVVDLLLERVESSGQGRFPVIEIVASSGWLAELGNQRERFGRSMDRYAEQWRQQLEEPLDPDDRRSITRRKVSAAKSAMVLLSGVATIERERDEAILMRWIGSEHQEYFAYDLRRLAWRVRPWSPELEAAWLGLIAGEDRHPTSHLLSYIRTYLRCITLDSSRVERLLDEVAEQDVDSPSRIEILMVAIEDQALPVPQRMGELLEIIGHATGASAALIPALAGVDPAAVKGAALKAIERDATGRGNQVVGLLRGLLQAMAAGQVSLDIDEFAESMGVTKQLQRARRAEADGDLPPGYHWSPRASSRNR